MPEFPRDRYSALKSLAHHLGDGHTGGEAGAFDAGQNHEPGEAVNRRAINAEVGHGLALAVELWANAGVVGVQLRGVERGVVAAYEIEEGCQFGRVEAVVDLGDPRDIRAELAAAAEIDGGVQAKPGTIRHRVDMPRER